MAEGDHCDITSNILEGCCVICNLGYEDVKSVSVSQKGMLALINFCEKRGQLDLMTCSITGSVSILKPMNIILMVQIQ